MSNQAVYVWIFFYKYGIIERSMGECPVNTNFLIDDRDLRDAQTKCAGISDVNVKNRAIANVFLAKIAEKFFSEGNTEVDIETSLHTVESIAKEYEISDVYVNGNYVDVRLYFDENEISVPRKHFDDEMLPIAYMFIKLQEDLQQAEVAGFILPDTITVVDDNSKNYPVNENALVPFEEIDYLFRDADDLYNVEDSEIYSAIDGSNENLKDFVKKLLHSYDGRKRFKKAYLAQSVLSGMEISEVSDVESEPVEEVLIQENIIPNIEEVINTEDNYNFTTVVSPNLSEEVEDETKQTTAEQIIEEAPEELTEPEYPDVEIPEEIPAESEEEMRAEDIDTLFETEENSAVSQPVQKKKSLMPLLLLVLLLCVGGYFGYTKFSQPKEVVQNELQEPAAVEQNEKAENTSEAMPVETVEKTQESISKNEGNSVSIPAIEQNLDASILVSNLRIDWEVPSGYVSNTQAKRYLVKLGKIIQLNLKAELLLLNKPPITNRIKVELKYNDASKSFETVGIVLSSGEQSVDNLILQTVQKALGTKLSISTESFGKLSGNPVLIIKL